MLEFTTKELEFLILMLEYQHSMQMEMFRFYGMMFFGILLLIIIFAFIEILTEKRGYNDYKKE